MLLDCSASQRATSSTHTPRPIEMKMAESFIAANSLAPQKWRVSGVPGREHTIKSDDSKTFMRSSRSSIPNTMSASDGSALFRRSARTFMPNALQSRAVAWPISPKPTKPTVLPWSSAISNFSQRLAFLFSWTRGTCLLKWSIAMMQYSAKLRENAPFAFVIWTSPMRGRGRSTGKRVSTPAARECTQRTFGHNGQRPSTTCALPPAKTANTIDSTSWSFSAPCSLANISALFAMRNSAASPRWASLSSVKRPKNGELASAMMAIMVGAISVA
mmetsp:Transcript_21171/g.59246  ORF Transcript_21171/g.59246 Transcript_21171/m.59246 type:complete len:273 (-) Transcript_21171:58-876(-)